MQAYLTARGWAKGNCSPLRRGCGEVTSAKAILKQSRWHNGRVFRFPKKERVVFFREASPLPSYSHQAYITVTPLTSYAVTSRWMWRKEGIGPRKTAASSHNTGTIRPLGQKMPAASQTRARSVQMLSANLSHAWNCSLLTQGGQRFSRRSCYPSTRRP